MTDRHEISIEENSGGRFRVYYDGAVLIKSCRDPEFEAARLLVSQGHTGTLETRINGSSIMSFSMDLEKAATLTTATPDKGPLKIKKWVPYTGPDSS